jgi:hypothetical protein
VTESAAEYVAARTVLLDALEAFGPQRRALVVVGAQAVYLRTGEGGITGVAPYTTDADLALAPTLVTEDPHLETLLADAGFEQTGHQPGAWWKRVEINGASIKVDVDVMVPDRNAPADGRRRASLPPHDAMIARKVLGLEGALIDRDLLTVTGLDDSESRSFAVQVAGPGALLIAKGYKLRDRLGQGKADRIADKDAADVYRLILATPIAEVLLRLRPLLADEIAGPVCREGIALLMRHFGARNAQGVQMASDALRSAVDARQIAEICTGFARELGKLMED